MSTTLRLMESEPAVEAPVVPLAESAPEVRLTEVERARLEDPGFALIQARARARGRGETHSVEKHGPFATTTVPRPQREVAPPPSVGNISALIERFMARGTAPTPRQPRDFKAAQAGDK